MVNRQLKAELVLRFGSQGAAAQVLGLQESRLSRILHWRIPASAKERKAFARVFGPERANSLLTGSNDSPALAGTDTVPAEAT